MIKCENCPEHGELMRDLKTLRESAALLNDSVRTLQASVKILNETSVKSSEYYQQMAVMGLSQKEFTISQKYLYPSLALFGSFIGVLVSLLIVLL